MWNFTPIGVYWRHIQHTHRWKMLIGFPRIAFTTYTLELARFFVLEQRYLGYVVNIFWRQIMLRFAVLPRGKRAQIKQLHKKPQCSCVLLHQVFYQATTQVVGRNKISGKLRTLHFQNSLRKFFSNEFIEILLTPNSGVQLRAEQKRSSASDQKGQILGTIQE